MGIIQQKVLKIKGVSDIVFCIDRSGSMTSCIEGVKNNISTFVNSLKANSPNNPIDWRIGFCAYDNHEFYILKFTNETGTFTKALGSISTGGDEFTSGAIDYCISAFDWRKVSSKFLVVFTDEKLQTGAYENESMSMFPDLLKKIMANNIYLNFFGPKCPYYSQFAQLSKSNATFLPDDNFDNIDFKNLMDTLGKTVSLGITDMSESKADKFLFNLSSIKITFLN